MAEDIRPEVITLRVKLGQNELEVQGPRDVVAAHFERWQSLIAAPPAAAPSEDVLAFDPQRKLVTLRRYPSGKAAHADAALLLLYGFRQAFGENGHAVAVTRLRAAISGSGPLQPCVRQ